MTKLVQKNNSWPELRIAVISDTHLGLYDDDTKNKQREDDSFRSFGEALNVAQIWDADLILHAGDLYHKIKPEPFTVVKTMQMLRHFCMETPKQRHVCREKSKLCIVNDLLGYYHIPFSSSIGGGLSHFSQASMPFSCIWGNHDFGTGLKKVSPLHSLSESGLCGLLEVTECRESSKRYVGKQSSKRDAGTWISSLLSDGSDDLDEDSDIVDVMEVHSSRPVPNQRPSSHRTPRAPSKKPSVSSPSRDVPDVFSQTTVTVHPLMLYHPSTQILVCLYGCGYLPEDLLWDLINESKNAGTVLQDDISAKRAQEKSRASGDRRQSVSSERHSPSGLELIPTDCPRGIWFVPPPSLEEINSRLQALKVHSGIRGATCHDDPIIEISAIVPILLVHQNKQKRGHDGHKKIFEQKFVPHWINLIIWGHEHEGMKNVECFSRNSSLGHSKTHVIMTGSSIVTSVKECEDYVISCDRGNAKGVHLIQISSRTQGQTASTSSKGTPTIESGSPSTIHRHDDDYRSLYRRLQTLSNKIRISKFPPSPSSLCLTSFFQPLFRHRSVSDSLFLESIRDHSLVKMGCFLSFGTPCPIPVSFRFKHWKYRSLRAVIWERIDFPDSSMGEESILENIGLRIHKRHQEYNRDIIQTVHREMGMKRAIQAYLSTPSPDAALKQQYQLAKSEIMTKHNGRSVIKQIYSKEPVLDVIPYLPRCFLKTPHPPIFMLSLGLPLRYAKLVDSSKKIIVDKGLAINASDCVRRRQAKIPSVNGMSGSKSSRTLLPDLKRSAHIDSVPLVEDDEDEAAALFESILVDCLLDEMQVQKKIATLPLPLAEDEEDPSRSHHGQGDINVREEEDSSSSMHEDSTSNDDDDWQIGKSKNKKGGRKSDSHRSSSARGRRRSSVHSAAHSKSSVGSSTPRRSADQSLLEKTDIDAILKTFRVDGDKRILIHDRLLDMMRHQAQDSQVTEDYESKATDLDGHVKFVKRVHPDQSGEARVFGHITYAEDKAEIMHVTSMLMQKHDRLQLSQLIDGKQQQQGATSNKHLRRSSLLIPDDTSIPTALSVIKKPFQMNTTSDLLKLVNSIRLKNVSYWRKLVGNDDEDEEDEESTPTKTKKRSRKMKTKQKKPRSKDIDYGEIVLESALSRLREQVSKKKSSSASSSRGSCRPPSILGGPSDLKRFQQDIWMQEQEHWCDREIYHFRNALTQQLKEEEEKSRRRLAQMDGEEEDEEEEEFQVSQRKEKQRRDEVAKRQLILRGQAKVREEEESSGQELDF
ncbi:hypothetical protein ADUPG1_009727 [Aduncisulcus paluster]|uniref:Calcineurin-like phosphoesterase domain-containing protein n=1 Tax=Aduncisulcus paluster TaxID=2918883 RepID=A0ABQ5KWJ3_9EUKA|nr:hypothetical protein ADUPG1_009727 [Aduncisulcus paluster]